MDNSLFPELNIIHLPQRHDRMESILRELQTQDITQFRFWDGIIDPYAPATGISKAHKQVVEDAKNRQLPFVLIAEDDIQFTAQGAFRYFCEHTPVDYDLYLGAISYGKIDAHQQVIDFSGLLFYQACGRFYDTFLSIPEQQHLDRALRGKGLYTVCPEFVVTEINGRSDNTGNDFDNSFFYAGRPLFGRPSINF